MMDWFTKGGGDCSAVQVIVGRIGFVIKTGVALSGLLQFFAVTTLLAATNDAFINAGPLDHPAANIQTSNIGATAEPGEPAHAGLAAERSLWWRFRAPAEGAFRISTQGSAVDTTLAIYTGPRVGQLTLVASNDNAGLTVTHSETAFAVLPSRTYYIAVDGAHGAGGTISFTYSFAAEDTHVVTTKVTGSVGASGVASPTSLRVLNGEQVLVIASSTNQYSAFSHWTATNGAYVSCDAALSLRVTNDLQLEAHFRPRAFTEDFSAPTLFPGTWQRTTVARSYGSKEVMRSDPSLRSGSSMLRLTRQTRGGRGSFEFSVSSEKNWDTLVFWVNETEHASWSGEVPWSVHEFDMPPGDVTLQWFYIKDRQTDIGDDVAMVDKLWLPPVIRPGFRARSHNGAAVLELQADPDQCWRIELSYDLRNWSALQEARTDNLGLLTVSDPSSAQSTATFYRAIQL